MKQLTTWIISAHKECFTGPNDESWQLYRLSGKGKHKLIFIFIHATRHQLHFVWESSIHICYIVSISDPFWCAIADCTWECYVYSYFFHIMWLGIISMIQFTTYLTQRTGKILTFQCLNTVANFYDMFVSVFFLLVLFPPQPASAT